MGEYDINLIYDYSEEIKNELREGGIHPRCKLRIITDSQNILDKVFGQQYITVTPTINIHQFLKSVVELQKEGDVKFDLTIVRGSIKLDNKDGLVKITIEYEGGIKKKNSALISLDNLTTEVSQEAEEYLKLLNELNPKLLEDERIKQIDSQLNKVREMSD